MPVYFSVLENGDIQKDKMGEPIYEYLTSVEAKKLNKNLRGLQWKSSEQILKDYLAKHSDV